MPVLVALQPHDSSSALHVVSDIGFWQPAFVFSDKIISCEFTEKKNK